MEHHLTATECHLPYGITQCYLPPDTSEHTPPSPQPESRSKLRPDVPRRDATVYKLQDAQVYNRISVAGVVNRSILSCRPLAPTGEVG